MIEGSGVPDAEVGVATRSERHTPSPEITLVHEAETHCPPLSTDAGEEQERQLPLPDAVQLAQELSHA